MELVLVETFNKKQNAFELIQILDNNNIPVIQKLEDCGGKFGNYVFTTGVKIFVSSEDISKVNKLIDANK